MSYVAQSIDWPEAGNFAGPVAPEISVPQQKEGSADW